MENLKSLDSLRQIDERHILLSRLTGRVFDLPDWHDAVSRIVLNETVPEDVRSQFNVARNMALYSYFCYSLAPEVQSKTFILIEFALRLRLAPPKRMVLKDLLRAAIDRGWIADAKFRHLAKPDPDNSYSKSLIETIPNIRNSFAHGTNVLTHDCLGYLAKCADFINQLYPQPSPPLQGN